MFHLLIAKIVKMSLHQCFYSIWMNDSSSLLFLPRPASPSTATPFCLGSAVSLSAFFNNGAMPCACHEVGAESDTCEAFGGQCRCRPNVIGRDCSMCATGYWGFPNCRRECRIISCSHSSTTVSALPFPPSCLSWFSLTDCVPSRLSSSL